jgi:hypothetical protein
MIRNTSEDGIRTTLPIFVVVIFRSKTHLRMHAGVTDSALANSFTVNNFVFSANVSAPSETLCHHWRRLQGVENCADLFTPVNKWKSIYAARWSS